MSDVDLALDRLEGQADEVAFAAVAACARLADTSRLARLARILGLADGGSVGKPSTDVVDVASTGGPGSLSTLLGPLYACALGLRVSKIGVPGRPAGGLDVLGSLPGYRIEMDASAARGVLDACGYLHVSAGRAFCPLDARFFAWRQASGHQAVPNLVITSLLAKKIAAGVGRFLLDIRVGEHGNLGTTAEEARTHARRLIAVAAEVGIEAVCVLNPSERPPQPWIGRGEALVAVARSILGDDDAGLLGEHAAACRRMALLVAGVESDTDRGIPGSALVSFHEAMLRAHGVEPAVFWQRQERVAGSLREPLTADNSGAMQVDLAALRATLVERQLKAPLAEGAAFSDPCGVELAASVSTPVMPGAVLARVRDEEDPTDLAFRLRTAFKVSPHSSTPPESPQMEVVRG